MKKLFRLVTMGLAVTFSLGVLTVTQPASAALFDGSRDAACGGVALSDSPQACSDTADDTLTNVIRQILNLVSIAVGIIAVIMLIVAGIKFITSQGESANIASARNTILYAIIGIIIVLTAQAIVNFVLKKGVQAQNTPTTNIRGR